MDEDPSQPRFFAYLSLFTFAMLMLVTADNLVQMFFGWEGVGLASYLLIGFWYHKPSANAAAIKAFVVNRVGDFGFSLGIFATFMVFGTVSINMCNTGWFSLVETPSCRVARFQSISRYRYHAGWSRPYSRRMFSCASLDISGVRYRSAAVPGASSSRMKIRVTTQGRWLIRTIAAVFDPIQRLQASGSRLV
jgi:hypothetical protein